MKLIHRLYCKILLIATAISYKFVKRDNNLWFFGEWFGNRCSDNSLYFANYVKENYPHIRVVWISKALADLSPLNKAIECFNMDTSEAHHILKHAGVICVNEEIVDLTEKSNAYFSGAFSLNLWHGAAWKKVGYDAFQSRFYALSEKLFNSHFMTSYFLSPSTEFDKIAKKAFYKDDGHLIKAGYPRNSIFYDKSSVNDARIKFLGYLKRNGYGFVNEDTKILLYLPTFRDTTSKSFSFNSINEKLFEILLVEKNAIVIEKVHYITGANKEEDTTKNNRIINIIEYNTQELMAASDALITDYSSCFFDYLLLDRPIIHYIYDYDFYSKRDRGLYYEKDDIVCGPAPTNTQTLIQCIADVLNGRDTFSKLRKSRLTKFMDHESSNSCSIIFNFIQEHL